MKSSAPALVAIVMALVATGFAVPMAQCAEPTAADLTAGGSEAVKEDQKAERAAAEEAGAQSDGKKTAFPALAEKVELDEATRQKYNAAVRDYLDYRQKGYEFRRGVFEWQMFSSRVIFVIVVLLVLAGIYFAAVQFHVALAAAKRRSELEARVGQGELAKTEAALSLQTQLEITSKGIVINSSILGVIVLGLSLGFFYLYLVHVYPIRDTL